MFDHNFLKPALLVLTVVVLLVLVALPVAAQQMDTPANTITVTGLGSATASPDMATIEIGVEVPNVDVAAAYSEVNSTLENIITAMVDLGISRDDIRTTGINIYSEPYSDPNGEMLNRFRVGNRVSVIVRDLSLVGSVIDTAVNSGANMIFGLQFGISDSSSLESEARTAALNDARVRAGQIADNIGATLGDVVSVVEFSNGGIPGPVFADRFAGGSAVVEPGQLTVSSSVQVTFAMTPSS